LRASDAIGPDPGRAAAAQYAGFRSATLSYVEKVRSQFLSLRHLVQGRAFSRRSCWRLSPVAVGISDSRSGLPTRTNALLFSETPVFLRTSGLRPFGTVLETRSFRVTYKLQRKWVLPLSSDRRERPISVIELQSTISRFESSRHSQAVQTWRLPPDIHQKVPLIRRCRKSSRLHRSQVVGWGSRQKIDEPRQVRAPVYALREKVS
jgi:hypothetical protein